MQLSATDEETGDVITLDNNTSRTVVLNGSAEPAAIAASGSALFSLNNSGGGSWVLQNLALKGGVTTGAGSYSFDKIKLNNAAAGIKLGVGNVSIANSEFTNLTGKAISGGSGMTLTVDNCLFKDNKAGNGTAIECASNNTYNVSNSSFISNDGSSAAGYHGGAISVDQKRNVSLTFTNCYFSNNTSPAASGAGGIGGAIGFYNSTGSLTVDECVFDGNKAPWNSDKADGAAIAMKLNQDVGEEVSYSITNSTFSNNVANDDGGAILIEGQGGISHTSRIKGRIENCTFYNNVANGCSSSSGTPGGAIQFFGKSNNTLVNNTFYGNQKVKGTGGAHGSSSSGYGFPTVYYFNNLYVGNTGTGGSNSNVSGGTDRKGNVNVSAAATQSVFGTATPQLADNGCAIKAGYSADGADNTYRTTVKSLLISPKMDASHTECASGSALANCSSNVLFMPTADQRGQTRGVTLDTGAVDIKPAFFNANGGQWDTSAHTGYCYEKPVVFNAAETAAGVVASHSATTVAAPYTAQISHTDTTLELIGWHTDDDATTALYAVDAVDIPADGTTYYAVWAPRAVTYTVTFDSRGGSAIGPTTNVADGATIGFPGTPTRNGYTFEGWYKEAACVNAWDFSSDTVDRDITLYAKWKADAKVTPETPATSMPSTGDTLNLPLFIVLAAAALAILGAGIALKKRKTQ